MGQKGFNLLQPQEAPPTFWDKAYSWVVGTARVIIIIIELAVFGAFVGRFILDRQTKALDEQIAVQQVRLDALKNKESDFRKIQDKAAEYERTWQEASSYKEVLREVYRYIPPSANDLTIQFADRTLIIRGFADLTSVAELETALKNSPTFQTTEVFEVHEQGNEENNSGVFAVRAVIKNSSSRLL